MSQPFLGAIILVPYNFAPRGYAFCNGQTLAISQNTALFSLLGTTYGGNGQTTFNLPDLRGRAPVSSGQGAGLSLYSLGQTGGVEQITLTTNNLPSHTHSVPASGLTAAANVKNAPANSKSPAGNVPATEAAGVTATYSSDTSSLTQMASQAVTVGGAATAQPTGSNLPFSSLNPYLTLNYCIALQGIFPSRN